MRYINKLLDRWYQCWKAGETVNTAQHKHSTSRDPLRFFWLAKLYVILHFYRQTLQQEIELGGDHDAIQAGSRGEHSHLRAICWLLRLRDRQVDLDAPIWTDHYLRHFTDP